jgi:hypothetical protein
MSRDDPGIEFMPGRSENILRHLHKCMNQPESIRSDARRECTNRGWLAATPSRPSRRTYSEMSEQSIVPPALPHFMPAPQQFMANRPYIQAETSYAPMLPSQSQLLQLPNHSMPFHPMPSLPSHLFPNEPMPDSRAGSPTTSLAPSDSISYQSSSKRRRLLSRTPSIRNVSSPGVPVWTSSHQARFASRVARLTASCGFPFHWVNNPEWLGLCDEFIPNATPIDRRSLANKYISMEAKKFRDAAISRSRGLEVTIQCDGWSGINFHHYLAFMITTSSREVSNFDLEVDAT